MSYVFDVYYGRAESQKSFLNVALYIALFPQLIAGPIVRYQTIEKEITGRADTSADITAGMTRFVIGLGKKLLIANYTGFIVDKIFALDGAASVATAWLGVLSFSVQLYFDFSGYSDMAIGLGRMFGFHFPENFNYPYISKTITEFWQRWHISLTIWFRDYVYTPLAIAGRYNTSKLFIVRNLFIVWFLTGIWHGAAWTFVLMGICYWALQVIERFTGFDKKLRKSHALIRALSHIYMLFFVFSIYVLFRSPSLSSAFKYWGAMFGVGGHGFIDETFFMYLSNGKWPLIAGIIFSMPVAPFISRKIKAWNEKVWEIATYSLLTVVLALCIIVTVSSAYNPFIYFNF
jgi:D-alanyl-lipoteichoic acid acyltransferase DltB (MBOAT superfamily)